MESCQKRFKFRGALNPVKQNTVNLFPRAEMFNLSNLPFTFDIRLRRAEMQNSPNGGTLVRMDCGVI